MSVSDLSNPLGHHKNFIEDILVKPMADSYADAVRASWTELENDVRKYYKAFKEAGCDAFYLQDDTYDQDYSWMGLTGTSEQIAATYNEEHDPSNHSHVLILIDLNEPLEDQWPYEPGTVSLPELKRECVIAPTFIDAINAHDKNAFKAMSAEQKVASTARWTFTHG